MHTREVQLAAPANATGRGWATYTGSHVSKVEPSKRVGLKKGKTLLGNQRLTLSRTFSASRESLKKTSGGSVHRPGAYSWARQGLQC
mmetsp:Transcript_10913/g.20876  ORF Transcript_10913/g.20876 Transcript_10913/m.20876 type:complete len:87 (+) Transcript_10913:81-341(+)